MNICSWIGLVDQVASIRTIGLTPKRIVVAGLVPVNSVVRRYRNDLLLWSPIRHRIQYWPRLSDISDFDILSRAYAANHIFEYTGRKELVAIMDKPTNYGDRPRWLDPAQGRAK